MLIPLNYKVGANFEKVLALSSVLPPNEGKSQILLVNSEASSPLSVAESLQSSCSQSGGPCLWPGSIQGKLFSTDHGILMAEELGDP